ncbi:TlpA disulfide reductase family protein [Aquimarina agarivorans]|uniref:TlpA disulfide reductase family protein n=1 Tax=Aquimarina agarivorans TaxID=980584 RepID=UPI000248EBFD|nr:TlpA disulfide reductase family protein [Aquimarina agarivorans]
MRIIFSVIITALLLFSCKKETNQKPIPTTNNVALNQLKSNQFKIEGEFQQFKDSTMVGLFIDNEIVDSTYIFNKKFEFKGDFTEPIDARILVKQTPFFADFWIENGVISIKNTTGKRLDTKIVGGKVQTEENILTEKIVTVSKKRDSLYSILSNPELDPNTKTKTNNYLDVLQEQEKQMCFSFLETYPSSVVSMRLLNIFKGIWKKDEVASIYKQADNKTKQTKYGKIIGTFLKLSGNPKKGDSYTDFTQNDITGKPVTFSEVKKKYTLLDFWSSWCRPCQKLNPEFKKVYDEFKDKGFEIVAISFDQNKDVWNNAVKRDRTNWIHLSSLEGWENPVGYMYGVNNVPENFLIDANGTIVETKINPNKLRKVLSKALK